MKFSIITALSFVGVAAAVECFDNIGNCYENGCAGNPNTLECNAVRQTPSGGRKVLTLHRVPSAAAPVDTTATAWVLAGPMVARARTVAAPPTSSAVLATTKRVDPVHGRGYVDERWDEVGPGLTALGVLEKLGKWQ